jgi:hypothetical protein
MGENGSPSVTGGGRGPHSVAPEADNLGADKLNQPVLRKGSDVSRFGLLTVGCCFLVNHKLVIATNAGSAVASNAPFPEKDRD